MTITLVEGVGFGEQLHFQNEMLLYDLEVKICDFDQPFSTNFKTEVGDSSLLVLRARWSATVEENIFVKTLVKKQRAYLGAIDELLKSKKIKLVAVGRGALLWLEWLSQNKKLGSPLRFCPEDYAMSSWIDTTVFTRLDTSVSIRSLVSGRASLSGINFGGLESKSWVMAQDQVVGWLVEDSTYLSLVDVFALSERAQLPDFGYQDLSSISTRSNLVQMLMSGEM